MTLCELYGGPMDGRRIEVPSHAPVLRVPVPLSHRPEFGFSEEIAKTTVQVARYVRCDHLNGAISYRYQGQEQL